MPRSHADTGEIVEIDGLRGIAISLVMVHRLWPRDAVNAVVDAGWIGVDLFFVISGFLITRILLATRDEPDYFRNFYARRVLRIFPLYYLFVGTVLAFGSAAMHAESGKSAWYLLFLGNMPEGLLGRDPPYWLAPVWSLAIEEQFYLTFPHLVRHVDRRTLVRVLAGLFLLAPLVRAVTFVLWPARERIQYLFTLCRLDAIAAGCLLAIVAGSARFHELRRVFLAAALAAAAIAVATGLDRTSEFGRIAGYSVIAIGFAGVVGAVLLARGERATAVLRLPALRYLGKLCFGLYLLHRPADTLVDALAGKLGLDATHGIAWVPVKIALAVGLASISWFVLERRMLRLKRYFTPAAAIAFVAACGVSPAGAPADENPPLAGPFKPARPGQGSGMPLPPPTGTALYTFDRTHSPITADVAAHLREIAALGPALSDDVFAKVGDSITAMPDFLTCFDAGPYDLGAHGTFAATRAFYLAGNAAGASPFARASDAATGGWTTADVLAGPLDHELSAISPRLAIVLLGTNDDRYGRTLAAYGADLWTIIDDTIATGAIPLVSTLPPMHSDPTSDARVPLFNLVARALAQGRQVPLVDFYREMMPLPGQGIGSDGLHPTTSPDGACSLTDPDLAYGFDTRNLITLVELDRVRTALAGTALDATATVRAGSGGASDPIVASLPLADLADTHAGEPAIATCAPAGAHQLVYALSLVQPATFDAYAFDHDSTAATIQVVAGAACTAGTGSVTASVPAGTSYLLVSPGGADGEVVVIAQPH